MHTIPKLTGNRCLCRACGEFFNSVSVFEEHRRAGRCLSGDEMRARGWLVTAAGFWIARLRGETRTEARTRGQNSALPAEPASKAGCAA